jgi:hypothetical protein
MPLSRNGVAFAILLLSSAPAFAEEPLRAVIDREVRAAWQREKIEPAPRSTDSAFLRRIYLDLIGTVPTHDETVAFLADTDPKKREKLIEKLLADPRFATGQGNVWDHVLFGRHPANYDAVNKRQAFRDWLAKQFAGNVSYDRWVHDLLLAEQPGTEYFYVQFRGQPEEAAVAVSRIFLGTQLQCARCHDHPFDKWTQKDFYGLAGFFVRLVVQESGSGNNRSFTIGEKSTGDVLFSGAAKDQGPGKKGDPVKPRFLGGAELDEPAVPKDFKEPTPGKDRLPPPKFSRKAKLAEWLGSRSNPFLGRAMVNRVWAQFMGRGVVHPIDDFKTENTPSHPELLKAMTDGFAAHEFDLKWLIREIANSDAYQLGLNGPTREALPKWYEQARVRPLSAEEIVAAMRVVTGFDVGAKSGEPLSNAGGEYFLRYFGEPTNGLGDFQGSLAEHLFLNNGEHVRRFISRKKGNLADTLLTSTEPWEKRVDRLYLTVLQRPPKPREREAFVNFITAAAKPDPAVEDAIWVLLNSSEFRFNH